MKKPKVSDRLIKTEESLHFCMELINMSNDAIFVIDTETSQFLYVNDKGCENLGYTAEELLSMHVTDIETTIPDNVSWTRHVKEVRKTGSMILEGEHRRKDKSTFPVEVSIRCIADPETDYFVALARDISDRRNAELALKNERDRLMYILEHMEDGIYIVNQQYDIEYINPVIRKEFGNIDNKKCYEYFHGRHDVCPWCRNEETPSGKPVKWEFSLKNKDKTYELFDMPIKNSDGTISKLVIYYDISEAKHAEESRKRLQAQLLHSQKMEAIGRLAGGIAHDFGNILTAISNFSSLGIKGTRESDPYACNIFDHINTAAYRAMNLTRQLLTFSRKDFTRIVNIDLNKIINNLIAMLRHIIGEDITIVTEYFEGLWTIHGDSGKLEQVITNLVVNSRDAMPEGGTILIRTENLVISNLNTSEIPYSRPGCFVRLTVEDTGAGISKHNIHHIFEPFFTTKKNGSSSGLGLSVVYAIISDHNGWINVSSEEGVKTVFEVYLPALTSSPENNSENRQAVTGQSNKGERILLVEDDNTVRMSTRMALEKEGYEVLEADTSANALRIFHEENGRFHLIISDLILPGQNGLQLIKELLKSKPGLKAILNSGYIDKPIERSEIENSGIIFLNKPYEIEDVLIIIRDLINQH